MKKIFTLISGLLLMSALPASADSLWLYVEDYDGKDIASSSKTELTKDDEGNYVIADFVNSYSPVKFTFEKPEVGYTSNITFTGNLDSSQTYPYLLDSESDYLTCYLWNYNEVQDWTPVYCPYVSEDGYSYVYRYDMSDPVNTYEYYGCICMNGFLTEDYSKKLGWVYVTFYFNEPEVSAVNIVTADGNTPAEYYDLNGRRVKNPANGIFIRKQGSQISKIAIR